MTAPTSDEILRAIPGSMRPVVSRLIKAARADSVALHIVGGPVRDHLLGRPFRDVDLIVEEDDGRGAAALARAAAGEKTRVVEHGRFGTVRVEDNECSIDIATVRKESYASPGALPDVEAGSLEEDLRRRDFTVNALAIPLTSVARRGRAKIIDVEGGLEDLENQILRVFHARSFHDDPTRALRAARLAPRLGFYISRSTGNALRDALRDGAFGAVSGDRYRREFEKLFSDAQFGLNSVDALRLLAKWHVLAVLEPGLELPKVSVAPLRRYGKLVVEPPWALREFEFSSVGLMVWLAPLEAPLRARTLRRLAIEGQLAKEISGFPRKRDQCFRRLEKARGRGAIDATLGGLSEAELIALWAWSTPTVRRRIVRYAAEDRLKETPVNGGDLVDLGLSGPAVGRALERIRAAFLDKAIVSRADALALAQELARRSLARSSGQKSRPKKRAKSRG